VKFSKHWNNGKGGITEHWSLKDALEWRMRAGVTVEQAFRELVEIRSKEPNRGWAAFGMRLRADPERLDAELIHYEPYQDRPTSLSLGTPFLGVIPADDWGTFEPVVDENGRPTNSVRYASSHEDAWARVEFDRERTQQAWLRLIKSASPSPLEQNGSISKREARTKAKKQMYETWLSLVPEFHLNENGRRRRRNEIAEKIASDPRAIDPTNKKYPTVSNVVKRLGEHRPDWWRAK
jgi:hypothetical protein